MRLADAEQPMSVVNPQIRFVYEDFKPLPESMAKRYELLDGEILMLPALNHYDTSVSVTQPCIHTARIRAPTRLGTVLSAPVDVVFGERDAREIVQPDVLFISAKRADILFVEEICGAPELIVEVLSREPKRATAPTRSISTGVIASPNIGLSIR